MYRHVLTICLFLLLANLLLAQETGLTPRSISTSSNSNGYYEYLPPGYSATGQPYALLVFIQGLGERGNGTSDLNKLLANGPLFYINQHDFPTSFTVNGKTFQYVIISPQFIDTTESPEQIDRVISYSLKNYNVDASRVYLTGLSIGGGVSFEYAGKSVAYASRLAALIPFASATQPALNVVKPRAQNIANAKLHVWAFHNSGDDVSDTITINYVKYINQFAGDSLARKTIFNQAGHDSWSPAYYGSYNESNQNIYQWMLQFQSNSVVNPLPVKFNSFTASCVDTKVNLSWKTEQESNVKNFSIEKSNDGVKWTNVATVGAAGNSSSERTYKTIDPENNLSDCFYRIVEMDFNGRFNYSAILRTNCGAKELFTVYPNPVVNTIFVHINTPQSIKLKLKLYDVKGVLVGQKETKLAAGSSIVALDISYQASGAFTLNAAWDSQTRSIKLLKQ